VDTTVLGNHETAEKPGRLLTTAFRALLGTISVIHHQLAFEIVTAILAFKVVDRHNTSLFKPRDH